LNIEGVLSNTGNVDIEGILTNIGDVNITGIVNITGDTNIEGVLTNTGNVEVIGGNIIQTQINDEESGLPLPLSNTLFDTTFNGNITQVNILPNNPLHNPNHHIIRYKSKIINIRRRRHNANSWNYIII
jgi:hypothetical protein